MRRLLDNLVVLPLGTFGYEPPDVIGARGMSVHDLASIAIGIAAASAGAQ
jgi:hypothetical protein